MTVTGLEPHEYKAAVEKMQIFNLTMEEVSKRAGVTIWDVNRFKRAQLSAPVKANAIAYAVRTIAKERAEQYAAIGAN